MTESTTKIVNIRLDKNCVGIGRGTKFGNPYSSKPSKFNTLKVSSAREAIKLYKEWLTTDLEIPGWQKPTQEEIRNLKGKKLGCYCASERELTIEDEFICHGQVLAELAELAEKDI